MTVKKKYPDVSELFARKEADRKRLARLPVEQKIEIARKLNEAARDAPGYSNAKSSKEKNYKAR